jgi:hypothetical protein
MISGAHQSVVLCSATSNKQQSDFSKLSGGAPFRLRSGFFGEKQ